LNISGDVFDTVDERWHRKICAIYFARESLNRRIAAIPVPVVVADQPELGENRRHNAISGRNELVEHSSNAI
jgi:hypothetical protein